MKETPPRAWGRPDAGCLPLHPRGNTPTGVGKTIWKKPLWNLREETPPRAWGRQSNPCMTVAALGNTPTGVGKTQQTPLRKILAWKHPHGRGEDHRTFNSSVSSLETPPRAWGRHQRQLEALAQEGNTPTGVGKTTHVQHAMAAAQKHPHGRGEDALPNTNRQLTTETPPRAWGRLTTDDSPVPAIGNTPTGVGKTHP